MTLRFKLLVLVAGATLFAATGVTSVALWREVMLSQQRFTCEGASVASSVAADAPRWFAPAGPVPGAEQALEATLRRTMMAAPLARAWVVDRTGRVAACVDHSGMGCPQGAPTQFLPAETPLDALLRLVRRAPLEASAPIVRNGALVGAVRLTFRADGVVADARNLAASAAAVAFLFIAVGLALGTVLVRRIAQPLTEIVKAAERLPEGDRIEVRAEADPELGHLVTTFNKMSARLRERRTEMERLIASLNERVAAATEEGLRAERLATLGGIAAGFAHEMGNSLHVIAGFTAVVLRELPKDHPNRADLESVKRESARAAAMLERFLFFARARSARTACQSVEPVVREAVEVIGPAAAEGNVTTSVEIDPALPPVRFDAELLRQAFVNLCVNAVQAMHPKGGALKVRAGRCDGGVAVEFEDTGPGVPADVRERIFEPFFTTKESGTGLGLAIVRQAAEAHGGRIEVENARGHGAVFRLLLPTESAA
jgi:two-component system NtrC family sensor kinase